MNTFQLCSKGEQKVSEEKQDGKEKKETKTEKEKRRKH